MLYSGKLAKAVLVAATLLGNAAQADGVSNLTTIYSRDTSTYQFTRVPDVAIVEAANSSGQQTLVAVWRNDRYGASGGDLGDIFFAVSIDSGSSWSDASPIITQDGTYVYVGAQLYVSGDGIVHAFIERAPQNNPNGDENLILIHKTATAESLLQGGTGAWSDAPLVVNYPYTTIANTKPFLYNGLYYLGFWRNDYQDENGNPLDRNGPPFRRHGVLVSSNLTTWNFDGYVGQPAEDVYLQEGWIHSNISGELAVTMRTDRGIAYSSKREESGWGTAFAETALPNNNSKPIFFSDTNNHYIYFFNTFSDGSTMAENSFCNSARQTLSYRLKVPEDARWSNDIVFSNVGAVNTYPSLERFAEGQYYIVWEQDYDRIQIARLDVTGGPTSFADNPSVPTRSCAGLP